MDVDQDAWVGLAVRAGELDCRRRRSAVAGDLQLEAGHVELCSAYTASDVEGYYYSTSQ